MAQKSYRIKKIVFHFKIWHNKSYEEKSYYANIVPVHTHYKLGVLSCSSLLRGILLQDRKILKKDGEQFHEKVISPSMDSND